MAEPGRSGAEALIFGFPGFPRSLERIPCAPAVLFCRGRLPEGEAPLVAVVGARRCTPEGMKLARRFGAALAEQGAVVVSGLARGIDAAAMRACLDHGGRTVGVLGCGLSDALEADPRGRLSGELLELRQTLERLKDPIELFVLLRSDPLQGLPLQ